MTAAVGVGYTRGQIEGMAIEYARKIALGIPGAEPTMDQLWRQIADAIHVGYGSRSSVTPNGGRTTYPRAMSAWLEWARREMEAAGVTARKR